MPKKLDQPMILDFETLSELGVLVTVNSRLLHPLGLAMIKNPEDLKVSIGCILSDDGFWEYDESREFILKKRKTFKQFQERLGQLTAERRANNDTSDIRPAVLKIIEELLGHKVNVD